MKDLFDSYCSSCHGNGQAYASYFRSDDFELPDVGIGSKKDSLISTLQGAHGNVFNTDLSTILRKLKLWKLNEYKK